MTDFTPAIDSALLGGSIRDAEFVRLTIINPQNISTATYSFSTSFQAETITDQNGVSSIATGTYTPLGNLVSISGHQRDLSATSYDTQITLVGIDKSQIKRVLEINYDPVSGHYLSGLKGGQIQIWRGFYDTNYQLIDTPQLRYTGIVTSYTITEDRQDRIDTFTLSLNCSSFKTVLENKFSGRHTNGASWNKNINPQYDSAGYATNVSYDASMDRVQAIYDTTFNFGLPL